MPIRKFLLPAIEPPFEKVLGRLGYNKYKSQIAPELEKRIRDLINEAGAIVHPIAHTLDIKVKSISDRVLELENGLRFESSKLCKHFIEAKTVTLLACTIGSELENTARELLGNNELSKGVVFDAIGSESVEAFADYINEILRREYSMRRLKPTMRYSPGYGDLTTSVHRELLPALSAGEIGINADSENFLLNPEKSITALIGWR